MVRSGSDRLDGVKFIRPSDRVGYRRVAGDPFVHWQFDIRSCRIGRLRSIGVLDDPSYVACSSGWPRGFGDAETAERDPAIVVILGFPSMRMANHASTRTTQLYDRRRDEVSLDAVERIVI